MAIADIDDDGIFTKKQIRKLDGKVFEALMKRYAKSTIKNWVRPVKDWHAYCRRASCSPLQLPNKYGVVRPEMGLELEQHLMRFATWIRERKLKGRKVRKPLAGRTIEVYIASIKAWHLVQTGYELGEGFKFKRMKNMITSFKKKTKIQRKKDQQKGRVGISADEVKKMNQLKEGNLSVEDNANVEAIIEVCWQGLVRGGEVTSKSGDNKFDKDKNLTREDVVFVPNFKNYSEVRVRHPMFKCENRYTKANEHFVFPRDDKAKVSAARALHTLFKKDPVKKRDRKHTPLFRNHRTNLPMRDHFLRSRIRKRYREAGCGDEERVGLHSLRIGGASTLMAMGTSPVMIQAMGRWSSDIYALYMRQCKKRMIRELRRMGRRSFTPVEKERFENHASKQV